MPNIGAPELIIILVILLLIFGGAKLPKLAKSLGEAKREFEKNVDEPATTPKAVDAPPLSREEELLRREEAVRRQEEEIRRSGGDPL